MITVSILVNGRPIYTRTAVNTRDKQAGKIVYAVDDGSTIIHGPKDGAIQLAKKMLDTIAEYHHTPEQAKKSIADLTPDDSLVDEPLSKRGPGRPKGSKNKKAVKFTCPRFHVYYSAEPIECKECSDQNTGR